MKAFLIIYCQESKNQIIGTWHTIEKSINDVTALNNFKRFNTCYKVLAIRELKEGDSIFI